MKFDEEILIAKKIVQAEDEYFRQDFSKGVWMAEHVPEIGMLDGHSKNNGVLWRKRIKQAKRLLEKIKGSLYDATNED